MASSSMLVEGDRCPSCKASWMTSKRDGSVHCTTLDCVFNVHGTVGAASIVIKVGSLGNIEFSSSATVGDFRGRVAKELRVPKDSFKILLNSRSVPEGDDIQLADVMYRVTGGGHPLVAPYAAIVSIAGAPAAPAERAGTVRTSGKICISVGTDSRKVGTYEFERSATVGDFRHRVATELKVAANSFTIVMDYMWVSEGDDKLLAALIERVAGRYSAAIPYAQIVLRGPRTFEEARDALVRAQDAVKLAEAHVVAAMAHS